MAGAIAVFENAQVADHFIGFGWIKSPHNSETVEFDVGLTGLNHELMGYTTMLKSRRPLMRSILRRGGEGSYA
ncbi:MAG: hypothetical protein QOF25_360, partial [Mycobacterium sp.]|nr:hypothetical protein [Mycobacterium sp.]